MSDRGARATDQQESSRPEMALGQETLGEGDAGGRRDTLQRELDRAAAGLWPSLAVAQCWVGATHQRLARRGPEQARPDPVLTAGLPSQARAGRGLGRGKGGAAAYTGLGLQGRAGLAPFFSLPWETVWWAGAGIRQGNKTGETIRFLSTGAASTLTEFFWVLVIVIVVFLACKSRRRRITSHITARIPMRVWVFMLQPRRAGASQRVWAGFRTALGPGRLRRVIDWWLHGDFGTI